MTSDTQIDQLSSQPSGPDMAIHIHEAEVRPDYATILGLLFAMMLIGMAILIGQSNASFWNTPSFMIVVLGTIAATSISYNVEDLRHVPRILGNTMFRRTRRLSVLARELLDLSVFVRKKGPLALASIESELDKDPFLARAAQMVTDGMSAEDIDRVLGQEVDALVERHRRAASILRRGSEIAPAMGLIGTVVGLVQMLAQLDDPASMGPAMALALITTFYGAIMGMIILAPLAAKLERNSNDEARARNMILTAMGSLARQDNPRRLEMLLNSELPPGERIIYFK